MAKRSFWAWGMDSDEPTVQAKQEAAQRLSTIYGVPLEIIPNPRAADLNLEPPRIKPPKSLEAICTTDPQDRASHTYGRNYEDRIRAFNLDFPNPTDMVAYPRDENEITELLDWCSTSQEVTTLLEKFLLSFLIRFGLTKTKILADYCEKLILDTGFCWYWELGSTAPWEEKVSAIIKESLKIVPPFYQELCSKPVSYTHLTLPTNREV